MDDFRHMMVSGHRKDEAELSRYQDKNRTIDNQFTLIHVPDKMYLDINSIKIDPEGGEIEKEGGSKQAVRNPKLGAFYM